MSRKRPPTTTKRQAVREQRMKRQRQQRLTLILGISAVAIVIAAFMIIPSIQRANAPVGNIIQITPKNRPQVNGTSMGDPNAPVKIDIFEDFQCPACRNFTEQVEPLIIQNDIVTGKVYYTFKNYPFIDQNSPAKESHQAANAAMCASAQGRFWDYHDMLFANWNGENQGSFTDKRLVAFAEALSLDMNQFNSCFKANTYKDQINKDFAEAESLGVHSTPSIFVNGKVVLSAANPNYVPTYDDIQQAIQAATQ